MTVLNPPIEADEVIPCGHMPHPYSYIRTGGLAPYPYEEGNLVPAGRCLGRSEPSFSRLKTVLIPPMEADGASPIRTGGLVSHLYGEDNLVLAAGLGLILDAQTPAASGCPVQIFWAGSLPRRRNLHTCNPRNYSYRTGHCKLTGR